MKLHYLERNYSGIISLCGKSFGYCEKRDKRQFMVFTFPLNFIVFASFTAECFPYFLQEFGVFSTSYAPPPFPHSSLPKLVLKRHLCIWKHRLFPQLIHQYVVINNHSFQLIYLHDLNDDNARPKTFGIVITIIMLLLTLAVVTSKYCLANEPAITTTKHCRIKL